MTSSKTRLFLGLLHTEIDTTISDAIAIGELTQVRIPSQNHDQLEPDYLVGYLLGQADHNLVAIDDLNKKIDRYTTEFVSLFGRQPKIYLYNYQW